jgi:hypothetical protein
MHRDAVASDTPARSATSLSFARLGCIFPEALSQWVILQYIH